MVSDAGIREVTIFHGIPPLNCTALHGPYGKPGTDLTILNITSLLSETAMKSFTRVLPPDSCPLKGCRGTLTRWFAYLRRMSGFWNLFDLFWHSDTPKMKWHFQCTESMYSLLCRSNRNLYFQKLNATGANSNLYNEFE